MANREKPGFPTADVSRTNLFPTFHLEHPLGKSLNLTLSYSKRIDRPWVDQLRPFPIQTGSRTIDLGNPDLQDQTTDSFEVNLHYSRKKLEVGLILYDRETDRLWSSSYFVDANGRTVATIVNAGERSDRGAQFDVSSPLFKRVKGMASVNLFDSRVPIDPVFSSDSERLFRYTANGTLEWRGKDKGQRPGDVAQIQFNYESRSRDFQIRRESYVSVDLSWTHSFSRTFSMTANLDGLGTKHYRHRLIAPTIQEIYERRVTSPVFKLKLTKTIGSGPRRPLLGRQCSLEDVPLALLFGRAGHIDHAAQGHRSAQVEFLAVLGAPVELDGIIDKARTRRAFHVARSADVGMDFSILGKIELGRTVRPELVRLRELALLRECEIGLQHLTGTLSALGIDRSFRNRRAIVGQAARLARGGGLSGASVAGALATTTFVSGSTATEPFWAACCEHAPSIRMASKAAELREVLLVRTLRRLAMVKALIWIVIIIFFIGLLVVTGVLKALF
ncbi:TonB-dependent receptor [Sphingomonas daechungensis]|uniref:TonB-dependent receptor n=1 Tax=Sphingomonas daechungensis TaxID=1176646 RepID=A0ABX6T1P9_9SPHN|nr:TonB-dependent receptor [Sphingomonas daechungensis]QNP43138.1 TonB-dependent receptor [Sphingomonas daechungensis]